MQGKRLTDNVWPKNAGEYSKVDGRWLANTPDGSGPIGLTGFKDHWNVIEHSDGTISVSPSIRVLGIPGEPDRWHGYLEKGVWREC